MYIWRNKVTQVNDIDIEEENIITPHEAFQGLGQEGWELVSYAPDVYGNRNETRTNYIAFLKRPIDA
jgi:hypothetical protein